MKLIWAVFGGGVLLLLGLGGFAIKTVFDRIEGNAGKVAQLERDLDAEKKARQADVAGLTTLSKGMVVATSARVVDEEALRETIDAENPRPNSPALGDLLGRLRESDAEANRRAASAAGRAGPTAKARAGGAGR